MHPSLANRQPTELGLALFRMPGLPQCFENIDAVVNALTNAAECLRLAEQMHAVKRDRAVSMMHAGITCRHALQTGHAEIVGENNSTLSN